MCLYVACFDELGSVMECFGLKDSHCQRNVVLKLVSVLVLSLLLVNAL